MTYVFEEIEITFINLPNETSDFVEQGDVLLLALEGHFFDVLVYFVEGFDRSEKVMCTDY